MATPPNRPIQRPGQPARPPAAKDAETLMPAFIPSIQNNPEVAPQEPAVATSAKTEANTETSSPKIEDLSPVERWHKALEAAKMTEEQARQVLNSVIQKGYWEREYLLWNGMVKCVFRTRDAQHLLRVQRAVESLDDRSEYSISQTVFRANISASLVRYQTTDLPIADMSKATSIDVEAAYDKRYDFVGKLPAPVFEQLTVALAHFDAIVSASCSEGAAQGF